MYWFNFALFLMALQIRQNGASLCETDLREKTTCSFDAVPIQNILPSIRSKLECAVACSQDSDCKASMYDATGMCYTLSGYTGYTECNTEQFYMPVFESSCHIPPVIPGRMYSYCETNNDCVLLPQTECRDSHRGFRCQCAPGLSYDPLTNQCTINCASSNYSTKFQADLNHLLVGLTDGTVTYTTLQACMDECIAATTFVCRSIEIWKAGNTCYLSRDTAGTQPLAREANEGYDIYQRDCAA